MFLHMYIYIYIYIMFLYMYMKICIYMVVATWKDDFFKTKLSLSLELMCLF